MTRPDSFRPEIVARVRAWLAADRSGRSWQSRFAWIGGANGSHVFLPLRLHLLPNEFSALFNERRPASFKWWQGGPRGAGELAA